MHEHEIHNLNNHVYQQNKTISHLKYLIERQTEFVSQRLAGKDEKELQIICLQHKLEKITKEIKTITAQTTTEIERLKESLKLKTDAHKSVSEKLNSLKVAFEELKVQSDEALKERSSLTEKVKSLKSDNKHFSSESSKIKKELNECKQKVTKMESEIKKKEEDRLAATAMLEEKTKVLETIQGLMGVRSFK
jgi:chromosome segregation ATPase